MTYRHASTGAPRTVFRDMRYWEVTCSSGFCDWLASAQLSIAATVSSQRLFLFGLRPDGSLALDDVEIDGATAITAAPGGALYLATRFQVWRLQDALSGQQDDEGRDALFLPQVAFSTGGIGIHDLAVEASGRLVFTTLAFNSVATIDDVDNFRPLWRPAFVPDPNAGNRCRLAGLGLRDGAVRWVTCAAMTGEVDAWMARRRDGGVVIDATTGEIVAEGLSLPDSPRWHDGRLWLAEAGSGFVGTIGSGGAFERVAFVPGIVRGMEMHGDRAVVATSEPREGDIFGGLELGEQLEARGERAHAGIHVIDLRSGEVAEWCQIQGRHFDQVIDLAVLPGLRRPSAMGVADPALMETVTIG